MHEGLGKTDAIDVDARTMAPVTDRGTILAAPSAPSAPSAAPLADSLAADPYLGTLLKDTYRIERRLGAGGMGAVYLAEHVTIKKRVAVKILGQEYGHLPEVKRRFLREARAAAAIDDEHVIEIHDFGESSDGAAFLVMEYLQGQDLAQLLAQAAPLPWARARDITLQLCSALEAAHALGIVHRDMKPANCFRVDRPEGDLIKVLDFGIAKVQDTDEGAGQALTRAGMIFGTPEYMAPEQARGGAHDHRVDIYAVGVMLFQMLTGGTPFVADSFMGMLNQHMFAAPPRPRDVAPRARIPGAAEALVLKALQKDPDLRFQSMTEMAAALLAVDAGVAPVVVAETLQTLPPRGVATMFRDHPTAIEPVVRRRRAGLLAVLLVGALGATLVALWPREPVPVPAAAPAPASAPAPAAAAAAVPAMAAPVPAPARIRLRIDDGGVGAQVFDESEVLLGSAADPNGLELAHTSEERVLWLRADGYDDSELRVRPDHDQTLRAALIRTPEPRVGAKKGRGKPRVSATAETPTDAKSPAPKVDANTSPDLIKPFGG